MISIQTFVEQFFQSLIKDVSQLVGNNNIEFSGPSLRNRENNKTISYNIYPSANVFANTWELLESLLRQKFNDLSKSGEVINYTSEHGGIKDQGIEYFKVVKAILFECYIYEPESFIYARLLHEYDKTKNTEWISIDLDGIEKSAWFEE